MKRINVLSIGVVLFTLGSCSGNNDATQQQVAVPVVQEQPVQAAPVDTTMAQPQAQDPAQADATASAANAQALPAAITTFIKQSFANASIVGVETDYDHGGLEYDVYLSDGTKIDFDANHQWETIDCHGKTVPAAFVPKAIATYVRSNYQNMPIVKIHKEHYGYEIELPNGLDLNFDRSGRFMGMDD